MILYFLLNSFIHSVAEHRAHGNRIIHEFLLGPENIKRELVRPKSNEYIDLSIVMILSLF